MEAEAATPAGFYKSFGGLPPKGGVSRGEGGRDCRRVEVRKGSGGLREALEAIASERSVCLGKAYAASPAGFYTSLGGLPPKLV